jgi:2-aminoethylphosphonate-pyruvate transaminase
MRVSTAVILAAGRGTRLAGAGLAVPKGLIDVGGEALVSRSLRLLAARGITDAVLITGHQSELYDAFAAAHGKIRCIYNRYFDVMGSLESLRCALEAVTAPFLLLDSDILYESRGLDVLLEQPAANAVLVSDLTGSGDEYYAWADSGQRISYLSKSLAERAAPPAGEHVGILKVGEILRSALLARAPARLLEKPMDPYESLLVEFLPEHPVENAYVPNLLWSEIDNAAMLETARHVTWPGLVALGDL